MQASSLTPLSQHLAHFMWPSKLAITWPQEPRLYPGDDMMVDTLVENVENKMGELVEKFKKRLSLKLL